MLDVIFFRTETGREPVREWLRGLDKADKQRIGTDIEKVQFRWPVSMPLVRKLETDLWEVRSNLRQKRIARVLFTVADNDMALLHGFIKKTQKTPTEGFTFSTKAKEYMGKRERSMKNNKYSGSSFDDFLKEEGIYEEVKTLAQKELASEQYKCYPIVIDKDPDSDYGMVVPDLPGCYTFGDTIADVLTQAVEAIELHLKGMLLDGDPIPEPKDIAFHENDPEYADGVWKTIPIKFPELRHYPVVIHKDPDSPYGVTVPDLPGCFTAADTVEESLNQTREAIEFYMECLLLDGDPIPEPKDTAYYQNKLEYPNGQWESVAVILPTDVSKIQMDQPGPVQRFFRWFSQGTQTIR